VAGCVALVIAVVGVCPLHFFTLLAVQCQQVGCSWIHEHSQVCTLTCLSTRPARTQP